MAASTLTNEMKAALAGPNVGLDDGSAGAANASGYPSVLIVVMSGGSRPLTAELRETCAAPRYTCRVYLTNESAPPPRNLPPAAELLRPSDYFGTAMRPTVNAAYC